jgi:DNA-directed RNA polymerase specialized sigma24 family protein
MPLTADLVARAAKLDRTALNAVVEAMYPAMHRIAHSLAGREDVARGVIDYVARRSVKHAPRFRDEADVERWFLHHTVLTARRSIHGPEANKDLLNSPALSLSKGPEPAYAAFIRALRQLPQQQREAVILNIGEHLNERYLAVAMDCSTQAAQTHLQAGLKELGTIAGEQFGACCQKLAAVHAGLTPPADAVAPYVRGVVSKALWPRRVKRVLAIVSIAVVVIAAVWITKHFVHIGASSATMPARP